MAGSFKIVPKLEFIRLQLSQSISSVRGIEINFFHSIGVSLNNVMTVCMRFRHPLSNDGEGLVFSQFYICAVDSAIMDKIFETNSSFRVK